MNITDIFLEARSLVDADSTSYPDATLLRRCNSGYEEVVGDLIALDRNWKFDDTNYTDLPIGKGDLVNGQQDYAFSDSLLSIERVEVMDASGNYQKLTYIDEKDIGGALSEYQKTAGMPTEYALRGNSVFLYPAPATGSVTLANGLKIYFQRTADIFTSAEVTTGTKSPGFASPYHIILSYKAALPFAMTYKKDRVALIVNEINRLEKKMFALASNRFADKKGRLQAFQEDNR